MKSCKDGVFDVRERIIAVEESFLQKIQAKECLIRQKSRKKRVSETTNQNEAWYKYRYFVLQIVLETACIDC